MKRVVDKQMLYVWIFLIVLCIIGLCILYKDPIKEVLPEILTIQTSIQNPRQMLTEAELEDISDTSSAYGNKWAGLCQKQSISSTVANSPVDAFHDVVNNDSTLMIHFYNFEWSKAEVIKLDKPIEASVAHRAGSVIKLSKKKIQLPKGEEVITDGKRTVRTFCCNDVYEVTDAAPPVVTKVEDPPILQRVETPVVYVEPKVTIFTEPVPTVLEKFGPVPYEPLVNYHYKSYPLEITKPSSVPITPTPEPATWVLFVGGAAALLGLRKHVVRK